MKNTFATEAKEALASASVFQRFLMEKFGKKIYLGHEQLTGWTAKHPCYLFLCDACNMPSMDYPHGFTGAQYLLCAHCSARHAFNPLWRKPQPL